MGPRTTKLSASLLSADFAELGEAVRAAEQAGCDEVHFDVMDGHFVPNLSIGVPVLKAVRQHTSLPIDIHMMVEEPGRFLDAFMNAGADMYTVHAEACRALNSTLSQIRQAGLRPAVALSPDTSLSAIEASLPYVDRVLVMTVNPGFGGQEFMEGVLPKIRKLRHLLDDLELETELAVDGGISSSTVAHAARAGARAFVVGSALFAHQGGVAVGAQAIRAALAPLGL